MGEVIGYIISIILFSLLITWLISKFARISGKNNTSNSMNKHIYKRQLFYVQKRQYKNVHFCHTSFGCSKCLNL